MANIPLRSCNEMGSLTRQAGSTSRSEKSMDEISERRKRQKNLDMEGEPDIEPVTARSAGLSMDSLTEEEINAGIVHTLGGRQQENYILVRNHILSRWRENVHAWLSEERVIESLGTQHTDVVKSAYNFLLQQGQINYGVSPPINATVPEDVIKASVVIIGAGLAGLAAGRKLVEHGFHVMIIEGRKRPGGRVFTKLMEGGGQVAAVDLGGSVITGIHENPLGLLARQLSLRFHKVRDNCPLYHPDGKSVDADTHSKVENYFKRLLDKVSELREMMAEESAANISLGACLKISKQLCGLAGNMEKSCLLNWHYANLENANAAMLSKLSIAFWKRDDFKEMEGDGCLLFGGNQRLIQALMTNVPIFYGKTVDMIRYHGKDVQVVAGGQLFQADMALCTVPLGVLKSRSIRFDPELPQRKLDAIERLGFGLLNKIAILFPYAFWGPELDMFGHLCERASNRGEFFLFNSYASVSGGAVLIALVAGESAVKFETMHPPDSLHRVLRILREIYGPRGIDVPDPIQTVCTRWGSDPLCLGACSHVAVGGSDEDYDILAESAGDGRIFFAGEATHRQYPATMHGAFLSGLREAAHMSHIYE